MMKANKTMNRFLCFSLIFAFFLFGCTTLKQPKSVFSMPDYTEEDVLNNEIKRIKKKKINQIILKKIECNHKNKKENIRLNFRKYYFK